MMSGSSNQRGLEAVAAAATPTSRKPNDAQIKSKALNATRTFWSPTAQQNGAYETAEVAMSEPSMMANPCVDNNIGRTKQQLRRLAVMTQSRAAVNKQSQKTRSDDAIPRCRQQSTMQFRALKGA